MDFGFEKVKSYIQNKIDNPKQASISFVIMLCAMFLIAGAAYAADLQSPQVTSSPTTTLALVTLPPITQAPTTTVPVTTTTTIPNLTLEQWGAFYVHLQETSPTSWQIYADAKRAQYGRCGEYYDLAMSVGWPASEWPTISKVMYRESRCNWDSHNKTDPSSGSRGLMQINGYWCRKSQWTENGWLQDRGILTICDDLFNPTTNLKAALAIWMYGEAKHGCGWIGPWIVPCN